MITVAVHSAVVLRVVAVGAAPLMVAKFSAAIFTVVVFRDVVIRGFAYTVVVYNVAVIMDAAFRVGDIMGCTL